MKRYIVQKTTEWAAACALTDFTLAWESRPSPKTEFRALHDPTHLHFRFDCLDDDLVLPDADSEKERVLGSDRVEIFLAPDLSLQSYYCLEMSPRGEVLAYEARYYREFNWDWSLDGLDLDATIEGNLYTVTGRLPLATLRRLGVLHGSELFAGLYRAEFHHRPDGSIHAGWMPWVNPQTEKPDFHVPASFGVLELVPS
ncbi:MAG TPA: endoxylanase [Verrucomicrobiales bacterium]|nr:endoxylanase [Verrucomicrobiales bacterium]HCN78970.1 endoxylanase [Verrucomicrobiales bacterium]HRJ08421.1 carbohydrate-binding family 9-like protein [Prosthecobacter sp.]HRK15124.1 carbohydrate-binding family 9-like protein [Prosthecobacter sp.]